jgi:hypothetical protein
LGAGARPVHPIRDILRRRAILVAFGVEADSNGWARLGGSVVIDPKETLRVADYCVAKGLFDQLVGGSEQRGRNGESKRLGGLEIDDEIEFGRLLDRDIAGLRPAQNLVDKIGSALE